MFDLSGFSRTPPTSKCAARNFAKAFYFSGLQPIHQIGTVMRSGEFRPGETAFGPPRTRASAQLFAHNPRIQRKSPAAAGSGERFRLGKWRGLRASNSCDRRTKVNHPKFTDLGRDEDAMVRSVGYLYRQKWWYPCRIGERRREDKNAGRIGHMADTKKKA